MLCHPEPGSAVSYALQNAKSPYTGRGEPETGGGETSPTPPPKRLGARDHQQCNANGATGKCEQGYYAWSSARRQGSSVAHFHVAASPCGPSRQAPIPPDG